MLPGIYMLLAFHTLESENRVRSTRHREGYRVQKV